MENNKIVNSQIVNISDTELDMLLAQSALNRQTVEQINRQVMRTVRSDLHRKALLKWGKLLATCFLMPAAVVVYIYLLATCMPALQPQLTIICYAFPIITIVVLLANKLRNFSIFDL